MLAKVLMIVNFTIDGKRLTPALAEDWLSTGIDIDNRQAFVRQHSAASRINTTPVRSAMPQKPRLAQSHFSDRFKVLAYFQYAENRAHQKSSFTNSACRRRGFRLVRPDMTHYINQRARNLTCPNS
jgi:hypothetical protein